MQRLATLATLALATHGLRLGGASAGHGSPAEAEQLTLAELLDMLVDDGILDEDMLAQENLDAYELA